jgi:hypothetical protein
MPFVNTAGWPEEILGIVENSKTVEYASLTKAGVPITFPMLLFINEDGLTMDISTALSFPAKAQRARNNPKVCLLFSEPLGCGLDNPPVVLVYGRATIRDADLQANTDRFVNLVFQRFPDVYGQFPGILLERMGWGTQAPRSDPAPIGKGLKRWDKPPTGWRNPAQHALASLGRPVLTVVDADGYPVPIRTDDATLTAEGFQLTLCRTSPAPAQGKACLTFHKHDEQFISWQENLVFVGQVSGNSEHAFFKVDRRLTSISLKGSQMRIKLDLFKLGLRLTPRLKVEARRRGQAVPTIHLPK